MIIEVFIYGFITAFGWWSANHYVIEPYFPPPIEKIESKNKEKQKEN
jgi:hypothetical protein